MCLWQSGTLEVTELRAALIKAGKNPTDAQIKKVIADYGVDADKVDGGHITFDGFQKMIAHWEDMIKEISR